jgi:diguanylate cyclase
LAAPQQNREIALHHIGDIYFEHSGTGLRVMIDLAQDVIELDDTAVLADRANFYMAQQGVPRTPCNFAVWFSYARGISPDLTGAVDILIAGKKKFDLATNQQLYSTYVSPNPAGTNDASAQLKSIMSAAQQFVAAAIADNRTQIREIGEVSEQAESGIDPRSLVECLMLELAKAATRTTKLEMNLSETSLELDAIRESLNNAEQRANTDILTGLPNRRAIDEFLRASQISAMGTGSPLSVLLIDIDRFKQFNDNFGHGVGDQVLRLLASALRERLREQDLPARYGGEELIAVLPGADLTVCEAVAERIRRSVSECRITRRATGELLPGITVSIGVAQFRPGESTAQLIERCDNALYLAKRSGRNQIVTEKRLEFRPISNFAN